MKKYSVLLIVLALVSVGKVPAAVFTPLPLPTLNTDIRTFTDGAAYNPLFPNSSQTFSGVPFNFQEDAHGNTAFMIGTLSIPANVAGATTVHALISTAFGSQGSLIGKMTFNATGGLTHSVDLIVGDNVRDHYFGSFVNTTTDPNTIQAVFGDPNADHAHLDMQNFVLPAAFAGETLQEIVFESLDLGGGGIPFLAGATVAAGVPDAGSTAVLASLSAAALWMSRLLVRRS